MALTTTNYKAEYTPADDGIVVDLSDHAEALMGYGDISSLLTDEQEQRIVDYVRSATQMSYDRISRRYDHWKQADRAHDVYVDPTATAFREKAVIADTRAISDTVLTYLMAALTGRNPMFQLEGMNRKSRKSSAIIERLLHQQMRRTAGEARLAQHLLDSIRYGYAPTKVTWDATSRTNQITNFDPRRVFHDPRVQWGDFDKMQYIIFSEFSSYDSLLQSGMYPKLKEYPSLRNRISPPNGGWDGHRWHKEAGRGLSIDPAERNRREGGNTFFALGDSRVVDECWVRLAGYEIGIPQIEQLWMCITILDENVVIKCQLNPYGRQFPVVIGGLYHDAHKTYSQSLYDLLLPLHDVATWLLRSRIDNVQAALTNLMFVDPTQIAIQDLVDRNPHGIVRTLPGVKPGEGVFISQIPDVTKGHWNDIGAMSELKQRVSAASDAQQGMPTSDGIRTATEIQRLTQLGSQRLGVLARTISATSVRPMVRMMVANVQDFFSPEGSIRISENDAASQLQDMVKDEYLDFKLRDIQGEIEYLVVDGTLPLEPTRNAETWITMLRTLNETGMAMEYNSGKIVEEAIRSMGVSDLDQFKISKEQQDKGPTPSQQMMMMEKLRGANVQSQENIEREVQKGNLVSMKEKQNAKPREQ
tara:strand:+ start:5274 stop:7205 length:1932 start_codon:yes stop_codon:yes gene_type:complete